MDELTGPHRPTNVLGLQLEKGSSSATPVWFDEFSSGLDRRTHFAVTGNLRDLFPFAAQDRMDFVRFDDVLWRISQEKGFDGLIQYDSDAGLRLHPQCDENLANAIAESGIPLGSRIDTPEEFVRIHKAVTTIPTLRLLFLVDYASHLYEARPFGLTEVLIEAHHSAQQALDRTDTNVGPTVWLIDRPGDLPAWFTSGNDTLREVFVELPNLEDRHVFAKTLLPLFCNHGDLDDDGISSFLEQFALQADSMTLVGMRKVAELAEAESIPTNDIADAIRMDRLGTRRNPWKSEIMRARVTRAEEILSKRVKGQKRAIEKSLDILVRSIVGLSGSQTSSRHSRPRGVLFLAGPTGVGKTELAKAITELLFGEDTACHRFDMSEFMEENSINRMIGAPPGYPGHEHGGQLVNAMHKKPFSVVLFDEVEKAHPRILDMFLQILDEGRLTDSRGSTAYFSEALIIFTSNIGMISKDHTQNLGMNILPGDTYAELEGKLIEAVRNHFRLELHRPELYNRLGQNIVAFEFISGSVAYEIFLAIIERVKGAVRAEHAVEVIIEEGALGEIRDLCLTDWFEGGRGIANRIETHFINPLSREIFRLQPERELTVLSAQEINGRTVLNCRER
ncbi:AAA family ATPase [Altererythrobacter sp.]|uniref:AAA family ATPase n=1 Tax=Altererythrobacter sp. TaxID=1872480 RepID=UPI001B143A76|nr:AAA family ATPase [Altererythrobacter sp.]MBO6610133.1 ATP-dependent Clp protease ATP-binding subunit [Altererythrobacter sp.]MBO6641870.1 ATP-dependent Clp protease ATP-binding subunit [Altererythrobacter sp.]MBO6709858.1 ATP-dependent Clp protease ATP-binding subunit [Altererythrobacter sp.]